MAQFMEALTNVTKGQDDLRVLVENSRRVENGGHSGLFDDVSGRIDDHHDLNEFDHVSRHSVDGAHDEVERTQLQSLVQGSKESFKEYAQKWRELAARFQPPMIEREMIDMFTSTLSGHYYLACSASANFSEMLGASSNTPSGKKQAEGYARRKEGNADAIYGRRGSGRSNSQVNAVMIPVPQQQQQHQHGQHSSNDRYPPRTRPHRKIDPIPMTYAQVLQHLLKIEKITLRHAPNAPDTQSPNYNANARCAFHSGAAGHDTERCIALKNKVQDLLDQKIIQFTPTPNIVNNLMPARGGSGVNVIESEEISVVSDVGCLTFPLVSVKQHLVNNGIFPGCGVDCENCKSQPEGCTDLKAMVQKLIDEGPLQFYRRLRGARNNDGEVAVISIPYEPVIPICIQVPIQIPVSIPYEEQPAALMITVPGPIPYDSEKAIPWHYGSDVYYYGTKEEGEPSKEKFVEAAVANTDNFAGTGRITRSGRVFSSQLVQNNAGALAKAKGKQVVTDVQNSLTQNGAPDNAVSSKDVEELLRIIRKSDYKVVEQLGQTQSKISILQLLMCSELEAVANNISAGNGLGFTDRDLPPGGRNHNKALHISMECKGTTLSRVLVDTGSSLNVLPKSALMRINYAGVELRPSELVVRAFDGSRRSVFGEKKNMIICCQMVAPQPPSSETVFVLDRVPQSYALSYPDKPISSLNPQTPISPPKYKPPRPSVDASFEFLSNKKECLAAAPGPSGFLLEYDDGRYYHPITSWKPLEEKEFVDGLEEENPLAIFVWKPHPYKVLTGDFQALFN
ncbi:uncharacterized protein LOC131658797 [Vicia villosa]|uniref:uncharacterized protein LOC131658797 n=1 Tax=Vicia villosa TaxID=3911 RepID=UPI00273C723F|nr:uncharacterized protein LOC131658797 [Vicia villosa]